MHHGAGQSQDLKLHICVNDDQGPLSLEPWEVRTQEKEPGLGGPGAVWTRCEPPAVKETEPETWFWSL